MAFDKLIITLIFISLFYFATIETRMPESELKKYAEACKVTKEDYETLLKFEVPSTDTGKCLMLCMLKNLKTISPQGIFNSDGAYEGLKTYWSEISDSQLKLLVNECNQELNGLSLSPNTCEYGYQANKCIATKLKTLVSKPSDH